MKLLLLMVLFCLAGAAVPGRAAESDAPSVAGTPAPAPEPTPASTPREFYNAGTRQLGAGKLREAEASLESALASQNERLQPPALYNLGLVRFAQGVEQLKKGPQAKATTARGQATARQADDAIRQADEALGGNEVQKMVAAYLRGRGTRKDLKAATEAVRRALQVHGAVLTPGTTPRSWTASSPSSWIACTNCSSARMVCATKAIN